MFKEAKCPRPVHMDFDVVLRGFAKGKSPRTHHERIRAAAAARIRLSKLAQAHCLARSQPGPLLPSRSSPARWPDRTSRVSRWRMHGGTPHAGRPPPPRSGRQACARTREEADRQCRPAWSPPGTRRTTPRRTESEIEARALVSANTQKQRTMGNTGRSWCRGQRLEVSSLKATRRNPQKNLPSAPAPVGWVPNRTPSAPCTTALFRLRVSKI